LNDRRQLGQPMDWSLQRFPDASHLWRFQLQYHEFLLSAAADASSKTNRDIFRTIEHWIATFEPSATERGTDAWHPYCVSRRISAWIWLWVTIPELRLFPAMLVSLHDQASFLSTNLEWDPGGNHLLENLAALGLAAAFFEPDASESWLRIVERNLEPELSKQILAHGEHFERSPMYHCQVLGNLLILACALRGVHEGLAEHCRATAGRMIEFLNHIVHPDGEIPLWGDSVFGECPSVDLLRKLAGLADIPWPKPASAAVCGPYWIDRTPSAALLWDAGPVGADDLPAHAHCDLLSLEASIGDRRWIVDSGNFDYDSGSMRRYCRSSVAHNVVVANDMELADCWSKFRMGFRGSPTLFEHGERAGAHWARARHDAYRRGNIKGMDRLLIRWADAWICADFPQSASRPRLTGYLHLAPELDVRPHSPRAFDISDGQTERRIEFFGVEEVELAEGWYCPEFGRRIRNPCLVYRQSAGPVTPLGWLMDLPESASTVELDGRRLYVRMGTVSFDWSFD
jgi:uncharacterized heparinase superfamily protein